MDYELEYHPQSFCFWPAAILTQAEHEQSGEPASAWMLQLTVFVWTLNIFIGVD